MATLTIQSVSGQTNTATLTYSSGDAQRIFNAYKKQNNPTGTQQDFVVFVAHKCSQMFSEWVMQAENVVPSPPDITVS